MRQTLTITTLVCALVSTVQPARASDDFQVESGFKSIFNGKDLTGWRQYNRVLDGKTSSARDNRFVVKDGVLVITGASEDQVPMIEIDSVAEYNTDFVLRLEFRASKNANSGIHLRDKLFEHQLQVRDYPNVGPYKNLAKYKPEDWNTLEITVKRDPSGKGAFAYATCNGEVIEKAMPIPLEGNIALQSESNVVEFRRIRIKEMP